MKSQSSQTLADFDFSEMSGAGTLEWISGLSAVTHVLIAALATMGVRVQDTDAHKVGAITTLAQPLLTIFGKSRGQAGRDLENSQEARSLAVGPGAFRTGEISMQQAQQIGDGASDADSERELLISRKENTILKSCAKNHAGCAQTNPTKMKQTNDDRKKNLRTCKCAHRDDDMGSMFLMLLPERNSRS